MDRLSCYFEIDFPEITMKKAMIIKRKHELYGLLDDTIDIKIGNILELVTLIVSRCLYDNDWNYYLNGDDVRERWNGFEECRLLFTGWWSQEMVRYGELIDKIRFRYKVQILQKHV